MNSCEFWACFLFHPPRANACNGLQWCPNGTTRRSSNGHLAKPHSRNFFSMCRVGRFGAFHAATWPCGNLPLSSSKKSRLKMALYQLVPAELPSEAKYGKILSPFHKGESFLLAAVLASHSSSRQKKGGSDNGVQPRNMPRVIMCCRLGYADALHFEPAGSCLGQVQ